MKGIQSNGFANYTPRRKRKNSMSLRGINEINLAELGRRTGISQAKLGAG